MLIPINPDYPQKRLIEQSVGFLQSGEVIVYPTDTVYGFGCDMFNKKAIDKIYELKHYDDSKQFSFICNTISEASKYVVIDNFAYRLMNRLCPGPYTIILPATSIVPKLMLTKRKTVGIRIPDNRIAISLIEELGHPIINASVSDGKGGLLTDPQKIHARYKKQLAAVLDGGYWEQGLSTILDLTNHRIEIVRHGIGDTSFLK